MAERPILFKGRLVRAILEGRKWVTRRVVTRMNSTIEGKRPSAEFWAGLRWETAQPVPDPGRLLPTGRDAFAVEHEDGYHYIVRPLVQPGDRLWVKEAVVYVGGCQRHLAVYDADGEPTPLDTWCWQREKLPGMFMPRGLSRITLPIVSVRGERVQEITEEDALAEGLVGETIQSTLNGEPGEYVIGSARDEFAQTWDEINASRGAGWRENTPVWRYEWRPGEVEVAGG